MVHREGNRLIIEPIAKKGGLLGPDDLIIAAHARALGLTLITHSLTVFSRVPGLLIQNWLK